MKRLLCGALAAALLPLSVFARQREVTAVPDVERSRTFTTSTSGPCWEVPTGVGYHTIRWQEVGTLSAGTVKLQGSASSDCSSPADIITAQDATSSSHVLGTAGIYTYVQLVTASFAGGGTLYVYYAGSKSPSAGTTADTELPTAAALADDMSNPTVPQVGAHLMAWNSTGNGWDRVPVSSDSCDGTTRSTVRIKSDNTNNDDETEVKATAGTLCGITGWNSNATTAAFVKCTNLTAANTTPGSSTIVYSVMLPAASNGGAIQIHKPFSTAITCYVATGAADTDATDAAQNEVEVYVIYN